MMLVYAEPPAAASKKQNKSKNSSNHRVDHLRTETAYKLH